MRLLLLFLMLTFAVLSSSPVQASVMLGKYSEPGQHSGFGGVSGYDPPQWIPETDMFMTFDLHFGTVAQIVQNNITGNGSYTFNVSNLLNWNDIETYLTDGVDGQANTTYSWFHGNDNPYKAYGDHITSGTGFRSESSFNPIGGGNDFQGYNIESITLDVTGFNTYWNQGYDPNNGLALYEYEHDGSADATWSIYGSPVPIPGAVWLLASGLVGLVGLRRRFQN